MKITYLSGPLNGQIVDLKMDVITIGSSDNCSLVITEPGISSNHASLTRVEKDWFIKDYESTNGVLVNGKKITSREKVSDGDTIKLALVEFKIELPRHNQKSPKKKTSKKSKKPFRTEIKPNNKSRRKKKTASNTPVVFAVLVLIGITLYPVINSAINEQKEGQATSNTFVYSKKPSVDTSQLKKTKKPKELDVVVGLDETKFIVDYPAPAPEPQTEIKVETPKEESLDMETLLSMLDDENKNSEQEESDQNQELATTVQSPKSQVHFLKQYCYDCHDEDVQKGDLQLDNIAYEFKSRKSYDFWQKVYHAVEEETMPPKKKPAHFVIERFLKTLGNDLAKVEMEIQKRDGRAVARRLTLKEYENNIKDLFGLPYLKASNFLPKDIGKHGFTKDKDSLEFSAVHLQAYMDTNKLLLTNLDAYETKPEPKKKKLKFAPLIGKKLYTPGRLKSGELQLFSNGYNSHKVWVAELNAKIRVPGYYEISFKANAIQTKKPQQLKIISLGESILQDKWQDVGTFYVPPKSKTFTKKVWLEAGSTFTFTHPLAKHSRNSTTIFDQPGIAISNVSLAGPYYDEWPIKRQTMLWGNLNIADLDNGKSKAMSEGYKLVQNFIDKALSNKPSMAENTLYRNLFRKYFDQTRNLRESLLGTYEAILSSPSFLYRIEDRASLSQYELANRLSYFLWNTKADKKLLALAKAGQLNDENLTEQVDRMIDDPKFMRFVADFTDQWLSLDDLFLTEPDRVLYPEANAPLFIFMRDETRLFFRELVKHDYSILNIVESDFAMLNEPLAKHYGIEGVRGLEIRPVKLPRGHERGGIITQGSVMKITANGTVTSPIPRGVWFLESILGIHLPVPSNEIPAFEPELKEGFSLREGLKKHNENAACATCHKKIDPPGFAFENFDPIGQYRTNYRIHANRSFRLAGEVDSSGRTSSGSRFKDIQGFQQIILRQKDQITKSFIDKLSIYATGKEIGFSDYEELKKIIAASKRQQLGVRTLIHHFIKSSIFRRK